MHRRAVAWRDGGGRTPRLRRHRRSTTRRARSRRSSARSPGQPCTTAEPLLRQRRRAVDGAEQRSGDRGDGVGVVAGVHRGDERADERRFVADGWRIADQAAWRAVTTKPLGAKSDGGRRSASAIQAAHWSRARRGSRRPARPGRARRPPARRAGSRGTTARTRRPPAGRAWVRLGDQAGLLGVSAAGSSRKASATGAVRISDPLPAVWPVRRCRAYDASRASCAGRGARPGAAISPST